MHTLIVGGLAQMEGAAAPPPQDSGKIHIVSLFPNPGDMDSFTGRVGASHVILYRQNSD